MECENYENKEYEYIYIPMYVFRIERFREFIIIISVQKIMTTKISCTPGESQKNADVSTQFLHVFIYQKKYE